MANDIKGKRPPALPVDGNGRAVAGIVLPIVDGSGHIIGWSPIATSDQGDGTLAIKVDTDIIIDDPTIILGNVKVGSTDQTAANTRWLKVDSDGTVHVTVTGSSINSDVNVESWGGTLQSGADLTPLFQNLDVDLSTRASELTLASVLAQLVTLNTTDFATEVTLSTILGQLDVALSTRASQATVASILAQLDVALSSRASQATVASILGQLDVALSTRASEASILSLNADFNATDFATESTLGSVLTQVSAINTDLDVALSTRASEAIVATLLTLAGFQARINTLGQKTMAASTPVVLASDQSTLNLKDASAPSSTVTAIARNAASVTLLASNANRRGATIYNDSGANLFVKLGPTATTTTSFTVRLGSQDYYEVPGNYTGIIDGIWASGGAGNALVTEIS